MSKRQKQIDTGVSSQGCLFATGMSEGELDIILGLKQLLSRLIAACGKDRYMIAAEISRLTLRDLSKEMLDKITSSDPAYRPDAVMLAAFCNVVGSLEPFHYLLEPLGAEVVTAGDLKFLKLARLEEQRRKLEQEIMTCRKQCGIN
jgi:hypothetical protein